MTATTAASDGSAQPGIAVRWEAAMMPSYATPPLTLVRGEGCTVWDADGRPYLDLVAGIAVSALGHAHPALVAAVTRQVATLAHTSNLAVNLPALELAERLRALLGEPGDRARVFFCNDGTTAVEAAVKLARKHGRARAPDGSRLGLVAAEGSFHGRSLGALAVTGAPAKRAPFEPLPGPVTFVPYGDVAALEAAVDDTTAAVVLEPALGEGGVVPAPPGYLRAARAACDRAGALLVLDEVQSGIGRTGHWFAHQADGVVPDVLTLAKGLGGGLPIGACIGIGSAGRLFAPGDHGSTFGGNPVAAAAALAVLDTVAANGLLAAATARGEQLRSGLAATGHPLLAEVRGRGLWLGVVLAAPRAAAVEAAARRAGFLVNAVRPDVVRLAPPLVLGEAAAATFLAAVPGILDAAADSVTLPT